MIFNILYNYVNLFYLQLPWCVKEIFVGVFEAENNTFFSILWNCHLSQFFFFLKSNGFYFLKENVFSSFYPAASNSFHKM